MHMRASVMKGGRAPKGPAEIPLGTAQRVSTIYPFSACNAHALSLKWPWSLPSTALRLIQKSCGQALLVFPVAFQQEKP